MSPGGNVTQEINIDGDNVTILYNIPGKTIDVKTKMGEPVDMPFFDGRMLKVRITFCFINAFLKVYCDDRILSNTNMATF